ncbi:hypothetical protein ACX6CE_000208 [Campylobacter upsaliensis]
MLKSLHTIKLIGAYLREKGVLKQEIISIEDIYQFFIYLKQNPNSFLRSTFIIIYFTSLVAMRW